LAGRILSGEIAVQPYLLKGQRPCDFCDYRSVCRFDQVIQEYRYVEKMDKARVLERIGGQA
jgi:ATP-dependent helicase/nuclease subunit B